MKHILWDRVNAPTPRPLRTSTLGPRAEREPGELAQADQEPLRFGVWHEVGDPVVMLYRSANRDEAVWPAADRFDVSRPVATNPLLSFGYGEHFCLGASLARLEAQVVCQELLMRFPRFQVVGAAERQRSTHFNGIVRMPVVLEPGG